MRQARNCNERRLRLQIKLQSPDLEVRHGSATSALTKVKWYTLYERSFGEGGMVVVDDFEIGRPAGTPGVLAGEAAELHDHAEIWVLYSRVIDLLRQQGRVFGFEKQVKVKFPHDGVAADAAETSYANPENGVIYIVRNPQRNDFNVRTLLHELGHVWSYQHSGDIYNHAQPVAGSVPGHCLTSGFLRNFRFQTHGLVADRCVAFYEGFAEYFKDYVALELFGDSLQVCVRGCTGARPLPFSRAYLGFGPWTSNPREPVTNLETLQRHDMGWYSALHALTDQRRGEHAYGPPYSGSGTPDQFVSVDRRSGCGRRVGPGLTFWDILRSFSPGGSYLYLRAISLREERQRPVLAQHNDTRLDNFLERVAAITGRMTDAEVAALRRLIDPAESVEPWDLFCPR